MAKKKSEKAPEDLLNLVEHLVAKAVAELGEDKAYGMEIFELIQGAYPGIHMGSVYSSLERLCFKGYLEGWLGEAEPVQGGRPKKYYRVTGKGKQVLDDTHRVLFNPFALAGQKI